MKIERPPAHQPIPDHAKKVFEGVLFDIYHWEQEMYDGSTKTFEKAKRADTVVVFPVMDDGTILITKQIQPGWTEYRYGGIGGRVDRGEEPFDAMKREMLEESNCVSDDIVLWKALHPSTKTDRVVYYFIAKNVRIVEGDNPEAFGEDLEVMAVNWDTFVKMASDPNFYEPEIIPDLLMAQLDPKKMDELKQLFYGSNH